MHGGYGLMQGFNQRRGEHLLLCDRNALSSISGYSTAALMSALDVQMTILSDLLQPTQNPKSESASQTSVGLSPATHYHTSISPPDIIGHHVENRKPRNRGV